MLYWLRYPGSAATHSVRSGRPHTLPTEISQLSCYSQYEITHSMRSGRPDALLAEISQLGHHSHYEIRQASCSTDWAILAQPLLTVWDQAGWILYQLSNPSLTATHSVRSGRPDALLTGLSQLSHCSQCKIRQARHSTDWAILAQPLLSV